MKIRTDKTIPIIIISYGLIFILPLFINLSFKLTPFSLVWLSLNAFMILLGLWKIETFEVKENKLIKTNFSGLFKRTINLESIVRYDKKIIDTSHFSNPFNIVILFSNSKKYLIFRRITIITDKGYKMKFDERTIETDDFNKLYTKIKSKKTKGQINMQ